MMYVQWKRFKWRCEYYFGYLWSFAFFTVGSIAGDEFFSQGDIKTGFAFLGGCALMSLYFLICSRKAQISYHQVISEMREKICHNGFINKR